MTTISTTTSRRNQEESEAGLRRNWLHLRWCSQFHCRRPSVDKVSGPFGSIHFIPGIYPYGVSLLTPNNFCVPSLIFGPLVAKYLADNGVSGTFWKNHWPNWFHTWHLSSWGESLDPPYTFSCSYPHFWPSGGQIFGRKWGFWNFLNNCWLNQFHTWHLPLWDESLDPYSFSCSYASFLALWWPNIWQTMGFLELFEKTIGRINFIPGIYHYGMRLLTPIHFRVPSLIFGPLEAKYLAENGVSGIFWKNY